MKKVRELIWEEYGFSVKLRCENEFDTEDYEKIKALLKLNVMEWKKNGSVPIDEVVAITDLVAQLARGSRFFNEETAIKVEDASIEIQGILTDLFTNADGKDSL